MQVKVPASSQSKEAKSAKLMEDLPAAGYDLEEARVATTKSMTFINEPSRESEVQPQAHQEEQQAGASFLSRIDLKSVKSGYHRIRVNLADVPKTAFKTTFKLYEFLVMPFGLINAPATFNCMVDRIFRPLRHCVGTFFDDMIVFSKSEAEHMEHLRAVFEMWRKERLVVNGKKSEFFMEEIHFLGNIVSKDGVRMDPAKIKAIQDWPEPVNLHEVRNFLRLCSYYRKFIRFFAKIATPLHDLTRKTVVFHFGERQQQAFKFLKEKLTTEPVLTLPRLRKSFQMQCDACGNSIGVVLMQDGHVMFHFQLVHVASKKNVVANALSRRPHVAAVSIAYQHELDEMRDHYSTDDDFVEPYAALVRGEHLDSFSLKDGFLMFRGKLCISRLLRQKVMIESHSPPMQVTEGLIRRSKLWRYNLAQWEHYLPLVEFAYNIIHSSTSKAPFEIVGGARKPPPMIKVMDDVFEADKFVENLDLAYQQVQQAIQKAQEKQKKAVNKHRRQLHFREGDWVLLRFEKARLGKPKGKEKFYPKLRMRNYGTFQIGKAKKALCEFTTSSECKKEANVDKLSISDMFSSQLALVLSLCLLTMSELNDCMNFCFGFEGKVLAKYGTYCVPNSNYGRYMCADFVDKESRHIMTFVIT
ncbi:hypothetical protein L7F22_046716 [Adiantum nelumboides]|nr:hypothetical protein [Adiantum nelumboides]